MSSEQTQQEETQQEEERVEYEEKKKEEEEEEEEESHFFEESQAPESDTTMFDELLNQQTGAASVAPVTESQMIDLTVDDYVCCKRKRHGGDADVDADVDADIDDDADEMDDDDVGRQKAIDKAEELVQLTYAMLQQARQAYRAANAHLNHLRAVSL